MDVSVGVKLRLPVCASDKAMYGTGSNGYLLVELIDTTWFVGAEMG